jgi:hypothetical protein
MVYAPEDRLRRLCAALQDRSAQRADLEIVGDGGEPCIVRLSSPRGPVSTLEVSGDEVTVTTHSNGLNADAGTSKIIDELGVDLSSGYMWDAVQCESADELAHLLVKHMRRRVRDADPEPQGAAAK